MLWAYGQMKREAEGEGIQEEERSLGD